MTRQASQDDTSPNRDELRLRKTLGPVMLWGLGVGYVISGEYFGWNLGLATGGSLGMLCAFLLVTLMYVTFVFSYAEMACAIPRAGGVFVYGVRGLGMAAGYLGGIAQVVEFVFAPPAIAMAIGSYVQLWIDPAIRSSWETLTPGISFAVWVAVLAYVIFTALNIWGVRQAAMFELVITVLAVGELLIFTGVTAPHFRWERFAANGWTHGWSGALAAIPFAIWFYLAIEGVANVAEEAKNPRRDVPWGFGAAIGTLVVLAGCAFFCSVGVGGWERVVYEPDQMTVTSSGLIEVRSDARTSDSPLPLALGQIVASTHPLYHLLIGIGLLGLVASFNGIILASSRALFEMGRVGFLPHTIGRAHRKTQTPVHALLLNLAIGIVAILALDTDGLITMSAFGAVTLYIVSMIALIQLRRRDPTLERPYRTPWYPVFPLVALSIAAVSLATMTYFNWNAGKVATSYSIWYYGFVVAAFVYYWVIVRKRLTAEDIAHFTRID